MKIHQNFEKKKLRKTKAPKNSGELKILA